MLRDRDVAREKVVQTLEDRTRQYQSQLDINASMTTHTTEETQRLKVEND